MQGLSPRGGSRFAGKCTIRLKDVNIEGKKDIIRINTSLDRSKADKYAAVQVPIALLTALI